jgi:membrane protease YdiL (CAAX protease family)
VTGSPSIGAAGWAFLIFAGLLLPLAAGAFAATEARRSTHDPSGERSDSERHPARVHLYLNALFTHAVLLGAALLAVRAEEVVLFARRDLRPRDFALALGTLLAVLAIAEASWRARSPEDRARLWVRHILPQTPTERRWWIVVSAGAALAEEVAYRGAFYLFVLAATGSAVVAIAASAIAFAIVHAPQGLAGVGYVFVIALLHQALVLATGTLLLGIAVHFVYDVLAGLWLSRRHGLVR